MAGSSNGANEEQVSDQIVELARIDARVRMTRIVCITLGVTVGMLCLTYGIVTVLDKPPWVTIVLAFLTAFFGPSGVIAMILRSRRKFVKKHHRRVVMLEKQIEQNRTSSSSVDPEREDQDTEAGK
jgi:hypothetical protein